VTPTGVLLGRTPAVAKRVARSLHEPIMASTSVVNTLMRTTLPRVIPASASTASMLSRASDTWAGKSPMCCGVPSAAAAACPESTSTRLAPSTISAWLKP
jgi:hypothetical protein